MKFKHRFGDFLFESWGSFETVPAFLGILALIVGLSVLTELLHQWQHSLGKRMVHNNSEHSADNQINYKQVGEDSMETKDPKNRHVRTDLLVLDSTLTLVIKTLNYTFMLIAMTYNFWAVLTMSLALPLIRFFFELK